MDLTETYEQLSLIQIDDYLSRQQEEHLQLDFKTVKSASLASADDRRNFAKSLSGFARNIASEPLDISIDWRNASSALSPITIASTSGARGLCVPKTISEFNR